MENLKEMNINLSEERLIALIGQAASKAAMEEFERKTKEETKKIHDRKLHNTKLLLENYGLLKEFCSSAIYETQQINPYDYDNDTLLEILSKDYDGMFVESIKSSAAKTMLIMRHVDEMIDLYKLHCMKSARDEDMRRFRVLEQRYLIEAPKTVSEIAEEEIIDDRTVYRDIKAARQRLSALLFGIDWIK